MDPFNALDNSLTEMTMWKIRLKKNNIKKMVTSNPSLCFVSVGIGLMLWIALKLMFRLSWCSVNYINIIKIILHYLKLKLYDCNVVNRLNTSAKAITEPWVILLFLKTLKGLCKLILNDCE